MARTLRAWSCWVLSVTSLMACQSAGEAKPAQGAAAAAETTTPSPRSAADQPRTAERALPVPGGGQDRRERNPEEPTPNQAAGANSEPEPAQADSNAPAAESGEPAPPITRTDSSANWISYGRDLSNTRHNDHEQRLSVDSVANLQLKWSWTTAAVTSTPAYRDGRLYFGDWSGFIVSLDAASGQEHWRVRDPQLAVGQITGSPFADEDAVYVGGIFGFWYRVDRQSGALEWTRLASDGGSANSISSLARIDNLVIAGVASFQNVNPIDAVVMAEPFRGSVVALDAASGDKVWEFVLTTGSGVGVSSSAAIDPARRRLFIGTGQNYDQTDSPYADSLVALDYLTGQYAWHAQFTAGDQWALGDSSRGDLDVLSTPILFTVGEVDMVAVGDKAGSFRAFDRDGKPQWMQQLAPGGYHGGVMGSPAYHDGVIYICSGDFSTDDGQEMGTGGPTQSHLFALDAGTGTTRWTVPITGTCYGSVTHANGVVYLAAGDGQLRAFADDDGRQLFAAALGQSSAGGVTVADGMLFVSYGWSWSDPAAAGGVKAFGLP
jgi:polyvinyl alcohol dehydrogenase (cytochrome)